MSPAIAPTTDCLLCEEGYHMCSKLVSSLINCLVLASFVASISSPGVYAAIDLVLIGAPGSGKGTIGNEITRLYGLPRLSTGDLVRAEIDAGTDFGSAAKTIIESGNLFEDDSPLSHDLLLRLKRELALPKYANGAIFDGYPRTRWQAERLEEVLSSLNRKVNLAPRLIVPKEVLLERTGGRLICKRCSISFHNTLKPPRADMTCDKCCQALTKRADDAREVAEKRIDRDQKDVAPLLAFYRDRGVLKEIDGVASTPAILSQIQSAIDPGGHLRRDYLTNSISSFPGPKPDVPQMYNVVEIYENPELFRSIVERMAELVNAMGTDYIVAPEARGWSLAGAVAFTTGKPLISIRKRGKLPRGADLVTLEYGTAYSSDAIELIRRPEYVGKTGIIIDDGNSTGGTALAVNELLQRAGIFPSGILTAIQYHYKSRKPEYLQWLREGHLEVSYYDLGI